MNVLMKKMMIMMKLSKKINGRTQKPFLSIKQFDKDYFKLSKKVGTVYKEDFEKMIKNYGKVNWENLKF